ncbi:hypothetical protein QTP88_024556 [Uroleucon formosanum]
MDTSIDLTYYGLNTSLSPHTPTYTPSLQRKKLKRKIEESPVKSILRKTVKALQQTVQRQKLKITTLEVLFDDSMLMSTIKSSTNTETTDTIAKNFTETFLNDLIQNTNFATTIYFYSPKAYSYIRSSISLPSPSAIRNWISNIETNIDFLKNVLKEIVFLLSSLKNKLKWPIGYWFVDKIKSTVQSQLIKMAITDCDLDQPYDLIKFDFKIDFFTPNIYFTPDECHNVKLARNALGNKISSAHINWKGNSMKVKLANLRSVKQQLNLFELLMKYLIFLNSRNPFAKGLKQPIYIHDIQYLEKKMKNNIEYLYSLKTVIGDYLWKSKRKTFIIGLATAVKSKSTLSIAKDLLANHIFKFILTYKFSQDAIEIIFGFMRGKFGHNNNPNCLEFKNALKSILLHNSIKMSSGNCALLSPVEDSLFAIKLNYKKPKEQINDEIDYYLLAEQCKNTFLSLITENVLYYISGYAVKTLLQNLKCEFCIRAILDTPSVHGHTYCKGDDNESIRKFTFVKQRGGLKLPSDSVYKPIRLTETLFKSLIIEKKNCLLKTWTKK